MKTRLLALALTMFPVATFGGQRSPEPGRSNSVTQPADATKQDSKPNQPAAGQPLPIVQPLQPANPSQQSTAVTRQNEQQARDQSVTVRSIPSLDVRKDWADYSQLVFTLLLFGVAIWQIWLLHQTVDATETAANAAKESAESATKALNMAHRPKLIIRHVVVDGIDDDGHVGEKLTNGYAIVTNVGVLPATLLKVYAEWLFAATLPIENPTLKAIDESTAPITTPPGSSVRIALPDREIAIEEFTFINNAVEGAGPAFGDHVGILFLVGYVKYTDAIGLRRTYFCRQYDTSSHYFTAVDHPSYSYED